MLIVYKIFIHEQQGTGLSHFSLGRQVIISL